MPLAVLVAPCRPSVLSAAPRQAGAHFDRAFADYLVRPLSTSAILAGRALTYKLVPLRGKAEHVV